MTNPNALYEDMEKLNALYEELCWDHDDKLVFTHDGEKVIIYNNTIKNKNGVSYSLCPFCMESKSNCVILLCGHLICDKCAKNINRCKFPCPKCKKPIKYIQFISE